MLAKQTELNQIEVTVDGSLQLRFEFKVVDGDEKISGAWHRAALTPGVDIAAAVTALNHAFTDMNKEPITTADVDKLEAIAAAAWTPEVLAHHAALAEAETPSA
jgi:hypothetical protein